MSTILAFMQNMWLCDPAKTHADIEKLRTEKGHEYAEKYRRKLISYALFAGCKSGKVLHRAFGESFCTKIIWEESTREIGGFAASSFPADIAHMRACLDEFKPDVVLTFGKIPYDGVQDVLLAGWEVTKPMGIYRAPHPAARYIGVENEIRATAESVKRYLETLPKS